MSYIIIRYTKLGTHSYFIARALTYQNGLVLIPSNVSSKLSKTGFSGEQDC